ncbi:MAG: hypothetical protein IPP30_06050 [Flavobacterium sp.]|nr:hypothetical protein [Flavobacterium sp.]
MEQEKWINEILDSTSGMKPAVPNAKLFSQIQNQIDSQRKVAPQWIWMAAATILLLIALNIKFVFSKSNKEERATERIASSISKSNQLY